MVLNTLLLHTLRDVQISHTGKPSSSSSSSSSSADATPLLDFLNDCKYTFVVIVNIPIAGDAVAAKKVSWEAIDDNGFIFKKMFDFISNFPHSKEVPAIVMYDKSGLLNSNECLKIPEHISSYFITSSLTQIQEADFYRVFCAYKSLSIALIERKRADNFELLTTACDSIFKSETTPDWPWTFNDPNIIFQQQVVKSVDGAMVDLPDVHKKTYNMKAIYFYNWMVPLCRAFTEQLKYFYEAYISAHGTESLEIFGCMVDFERYLDDSKVAVLTEMPWPMLRCSQAEMDAIKFTLNVSYVPSLVFLDENNDIITRNGRWLVQADPRADNVWSQWKWQLSSPVEWRAVRPPNFYLIWEVPSLIFFGEQEDEPYIDEWIAAIGQKQFEDVNRRLQNIGFSDVKQPHVNRDTFLRSSALMLFKSIDDDEFLMRYGLFELGLPLAVIFDPYCGIYVCDDSDLSPDTLEVFVDSYYGGELNATIAASPHSSTSKSTPQPSDAVRTFLLDAPTGE